MECFLTVRACSIVMQRRVRRRSRRTFSTHFEIFQRRFFSHFFICWFFSSKFMSVFLQVRFLQGLDIQSYLMQQTVNRMESDHINIGPLCVEARVTMMPHHNCRCGNRSTGFVLCSWTMTLISTLGQNTTVPCQTGCTRWTEYLWLSAPGTS